MIEIRNLSKIYRASVDKPCTAIDNISLNLPNTGMIFITGKSGSGKSTLLNMIGTLDNISRGDIYVDNRSLKKFNEKQAQEYRSSYLGFIFQDFLLLDELTVKENIELALNISGITNEEIFKDIIKRVDLEGKEDKFPNELSGGQRQRVAIARALIKNPKLLLCDEPTGNLDQRTSKQIFNILKEEAKTKLVIVVSHNLIDAENYADRIIELFDGKILHDNSKKDGYVNEFTETDNYVILPHHKDLTNKELTVLDNKAKNQKFRIVQNKGGFYPTKNVPIERGELIMSSCHIERKNKLKLSKMFFRKNKHGAPYIVLMTTLLISLFYIFQVFISFDGNFALKNSTIFEPPSYIKISEQANKGTLSSSQIHLVTDDEIEDYYDAGYNGEIYKLYNYTVDIKQHRLTQGGYTRFSSMCDYNYINESFGLLCCDLEYLTKIYGQDGSLKVLAGDISNAQNKIIITDYTADAIMYQKNKDYSNYDAVLNSISKSICAIIDTGYKERYSKVLQDGQEAINQKLTSNQYFEKYSTDEEHIKFISEVKQFLGISYTFSTDFYNDYKPQSSKTRFSVYNSYIESSEKVSSFQTTFELTSKLEKNQVILSYSTYNQLFDKLYTPETLSTFEPHKVKIYKYDNNSLEGKKIYELELEIVRLEDNSYISYETMKNLNCFTYFAYGVYFDNAENLNIINDVSQKNGYLLNSIDTGVVPVINTVLALFKSFCVLIIGLLFIASFLHIVFYGINCIRKNIYEIGVLKSLGAKSSDISIMFIGQIAFVGLILSFTSIIGIFVCSKISNNILVSAFEDFMTITIFDLDIIGFNANIMFIDILIVFVLIIISSIIPFIYLKAIKPLNILKGRKK